MDFPHHLVDSHTYRNFGIELSIYQKCWKHILGTFIFVRFYQCLLISENRNCRVTLTIDWIWCAWTCPLCISMLFFWRQFSDFKRQRHNHNPMHLFAFLQIFPLLSCVRLNSFLLFFFIIIINRSLMHVYLHQLAQSTLWLESDSTDCFSLRFSSFIIFYLEWVVLVFQSVI